METPQDRQASAPAEHRPASPDQAPAAVIPVARPAPPQVFPWRRWVLLGALVLGLAVAAWFLVPSVILMFTTVSTDDAYVNSHVTFVAPRVAGQVKKVLVDDNWRVKMGDVLVLLDPEPYQVQVNIKKGALDVARADLVAAEAQARAQVAQARGNRFKLEHAIEDVNNQLANLRAAVANYKSKQATLELAKANYERGKELVPKSLSKEELDQRKQAVQVSAANVEQALQTIYAIRVGLGLPTEPPKGKDLSDHPENLDQDYSAVRQALAEMLQSAAPLGIFPKSYNLTPKQVIKEFYERDPARKQLIAQVIAAQGLATTPASLPILLPSVVAVDIASGAVLALDPSGDLDRIYAQILRTAPAVKQARARVEQAEDDLEQAKLNLRYCTIVSDIDGVVTRRNVNAGNNVQVGQSLMAVRSLTEIWIDANFKETQLAPLRIGQVVKVEVDMYGSRREFEGRITGFTMGTGQTLSLLPPQNATGNFVKIVQRLPVRIELTEYKPGPPGEPVLFVGLSCTPYVYIYRPVDDKVLGHGNFLQPFAPLPQAPTEPRP
jgi:membrane fusion protein (multidrug efflux system)